MNSGTPRPLPPSRLGPPAMIFPGSHALLFPFQRIRHQSAMALPGVRSIFLNVAGNGHPPADRFRLLAAPPLRPLLPGETVVLLAGQLAKVDVRRGNF